MAQPPHDQAGLPSPALLSLSYQPAVTYCPECGRLQVAQTRNRQIVAYICTDCHHEASAKLRPDCPACAAILLRAGV